MPRRARLLLATVLGTTLLLGGCSSAASDDEATGTPSSAPGASAHARRLDDPGEAHRPPRGHDRARRASGRSRGT